MCSFQSAKPHFVERPDFICGQRFAEEGEFVDLAVEIADLLGTVFHGSSPVSDFRLAESLDDQQCKLLVIEWQGDLLLLSSPIENRQSGDSHTPRGEVSARFKLVELLP